MGFLKKAANQSDLDLVLIDLKSVYGKRMHFMSAWEHLQVSRGFELSLHLNHSTRYETSELNQCYWSKLWSRK